jgi:hypothetical protein
LEEIRKMGVPFVEFEAQVIKTLATRGGSVGAAMDAVEREQPGLHARFLTDPATAFIAGDLRSWADDVIAEAKAMRKDQPAAAGTPSFNFWQVVGLYQAEGLDRSQAIRKTVIYFPDLQQRLLDDGRQAATDRSAVKPSFPPQTNYTPSPKGASTMQQTPTSFESAVAAAIRAGKTRSQAIRMVVEQYPDLHVAYLEKANADHDRKRGKGQS